MDEINWEVVLWVINSCEFVVSTKYEFFPKQPKEVEIGNREYKLSLDYSNFKQKTLEKNLNKKATQMNYRINEGGGKAIYFIGVKDNGDVDGIPIVKLFISLLFFSKIVSLCNSFYKKIKIYKAKNGFISTIRVYKKCNEKYKLLEL